MEGAGRSGAQSFTRGFQRGQTFDRFARLQAQRLAQNFSRQLGNIRAGIDQSRFVQSARNAGRRASTAISTAFRNVSASFNSNQFVLQARAAGQRARQALASNLNRFTASINDSQFLLQVRAMARRARDSIQSSFRNIRAEINLRGAIRRAGAQGTQAGNAFARNFNQEASKAGDGVDPGSNIGGGGGGGGRNLTALAAGASLLAVALARLGPLLFAIPAATAVATAGIATLAVAFQGFGEAIGAAGDPDKFREALENLSPAAAEVAKEFAALNLGDLRLEVQEALFSQLTGTITALGEALRGPLLEGMTTAAEAFGRFFAQIGAFFAQPLTAEAFTAVFETLAGLLDSIGPGFISFLEGFRDLTVAMLPAIETFGQTLNNLLTQFGTFMSDQATSGQALASFGAAMSTVLGILQIGMSVFGALNGVLAGLSPALEALGPALSSGIEALTPGLTSLAIAFGQVIEAAAPLLEVIGENLGTILGGLAPIIFSVADAFTSLLDVVLPIINDQLMPLFQELVTTFAADLATAVTSFLAVIVELAPVLLNLAAQVLPILLEMFTENGDKIVALIPAIGDLVVALVETLLPAIVDLLPLILTFSTLFMDIALEVLPELLPALTDLVQNMSPLLELFTDFLSLLEGPLRGAISFIAGLIGGLTSVVRILVDAVNDAVSAFQTLIGVQSGANLERGTVQGNAKGNIFDRATLTWVGEAGREVLLPMAYPDRAVSLAQQSGLTDMLIAHGAMGSGKGGGRSVGDVTINVHSPSANPHHVARRVSAEFARAVWGDS